MIATVYPYLCKPLPDRPERGLTHGGGFYESGVVITADEVDADGRVTVDVEFEVGGADSMVLCGYAIARHPPDAIVGVTAIIEDHAFDGSGCVYDQRVLRLLRWRLEVACRPDALL